MEADLVSLFVIVLAAFICPLVSSLIPNKLIPETVFLLTAGMLLGPNVFSIAQPDSAISLLSDLGLGVLFLLAGYEIDPKELAGKKGRYGFLTWLATFAISIGICLILPASRENLFGWLAAAIALTTTAFGTLVPILHERGIFGTPIGQTITSYGVWGEICPIIAIALILTTRNTVMTLIILGSFAVLAVITALISKWLKKEESRIAKFIIKHKDASVQMSIRVIMLLLVGLVTISAVFDLDIVLGAFAAGFILRYVIPEGDEGTEYKLNGIGYGFLIPLFFIVSGMGINPRAIAEYPLLLLGFLIALLVVRALPIFISLKINPETRSYSIQQRSTVALYCTTALPLIVAVTSIATGVGAMSTDIASLLVAAGGISVFIMPFGASLSLKAIGRIEEHEERDGNVGENIE